MKKRATLKDVAKEAGVAVSTVSGIINNRSDSWASEATRQRVFEAAAKLDFTPNRLARALRLDSFQLILVMLPDLSNQLHGMLSRLIRQAWEAHGYEIVIEETEYDSAREQRIIEGLPKRMVDGFVGVLSNPEALRPVVSRIAKSVPMVLIGDRMPECPLDSVEGEFHGGILLALRHLIERGHRRVGFVDGLGGICDPLQRFSFFREVLSHHQLKLEESWVLQATPDLETTATSVCEWVSQLRRDTGPTALFCSNDLTAIATLRGLNAAGLDVPRDMSVVGFDNIPLASVVNPPLTTVHQPVRRLAERSCGLLLDRINNKVSGFGAHEILSTHLVERSSVATVDA